MSDASARERSVAVRVARDLAGTVADWIGRSRLRTALGRLSDRLGTAAGDSAASRATAALAAWVRHSWCYRWLTAEPDSEVIVIDLRETYTVGPVVRVLERIANPLATAWRSSGVADVAETVADAPLRALGVVIATATLVHLSLALASGSLGRTALGARLIVLAFAALAIRERRSAGELAETRVGRVLEAVFEPPAPDERGKRQESGAREGIERRESDRSDG